MIKERLELTVKALLIGLILTVVFCGANVYLGLKIGITVSASVPAAVLAMGFLRMFKQYSTLENSIAQTTASVGESVAVAIIFVFPALLIMKVQSNLNYWQMLLSVLPGGVIGVVYAIILRKILLNDKQLTFPEGQAIGKILNNTEKQAEKGNGRLLIVGGIVAAFINLCQNGFQIISGGISKGVLVGGRLIGGGITVSPAIIGAGFLVGFAPMFVAFIALIFTWCVLLPIFTGIYGIQDVKDITGSAFFIWKMYLRPIGVGVFIFTGFATIIMLGGQVVRGIKESLGAFQKFTNSSNDDKDLNFVKLFGVTAIASIPIVLLLMNELNKFTSFNGVVNLLIAIAILLVMLFIGFAIAAVAGYFAGLVGSSSSPVSGLLFIAVIFSTLILVIVTMGSANSAKSDMLTTIIVLTGFIAGTASISNGSIQDFKSGQIVGSTPYKQQIGLFCGVILAVFIAPIFLTLIFNAYGIAGVVPHAGMDVNNTLSAPQASAVAALANNIIGGSQNWNLLIFGIIIGAVGLVLDIIGKKTGKYRCSLVSIGMGIYLPPGNIVALFIGGVLRLFVDKRQAKIGQTNGEDIRERLHNKSNLFVCGLIAGESLMGLLLAIPFVVFKDNNIMKLVGNGFTNIADTVAVVVTLLILYYIHKVGTRLNR